jgi:hypothetical protein
MGGSSKLPGTDIEISRSNLKRSSIQIGVESTPSTRSRHPRRQQSPRRQHVPADVAGKLQKRVRVPDKDQVAIQEIGPLNGIASGRARHFKHYDGLTRQAREVFSRKSLDRLAFSYVTGISLNLDANDKCNKLVENSYPI